MAEITKPVDINKIWASAGDILAPSDSKIATGWQVEIPARQYFNYIDWKQDQAIAHINQHGIAVWDSSTEYQYSVSGTKSICMGSNGVVYRAKQVNSSQNPVLDTTNVYWEVAFASLSDLYTQTQSDARYLQKSANLSDLTNTATARTNLSVYSQAQTYSQSQVDARTTIATSVQAQAQTSDTVLISPLKLFQAFQSGNQALSANGYQKFPGGLIVQWGSFTTTAGSANVTFTIPFPTATASVMVTDNGASTWSTTNISTTGVQTPTLSGFTGKTFSWNGSTYILGAAACRYFAVGY